MAHQKSLLQSLTLVLLSIFAVTCFDIVVCAQETLSVAARGVGVDEKEAKKDALINAMQQAVGAFLDAETLIENDEVIREKILSVSDGFVKKYDIVDGPSRRADGLYEISIRAVVQQGKVQERLKAVRILSNAVSGKDAAAEVYTKITNADQGVQLLNKHLSGLLPKLLVARLVDEKGKATKQVGPITEIQADRRIKCTWNVEVYFDMKAFYKQVVPQLEKVFQAISKEQPGSCVCVGERLKAEELFGELRGAMSFTNSPAFKLKSWRGELPTRDLESTEFSVLMSIGRDRFGENERFRHYSINRNLYAETLQQLRSEATATNLHLYTMNADGGIIGEEVIPIDQKRRERYQLDFLRSYNFHRMHHGRMPPAAVIVSPRISISASPTGVDREDFYTDTLLIPYSILISQSDLESITEVRFQFK